MTFDEVKELEIPLGKAKNIIGKRFGKLTVIFRIKSNDSEVRFACKCDCGNYHIVSRRNLQGGHVKSCGCISNAIDITGQQFSELTALYPTDERDGNSIMWMCKCSCGEYTLAATNRLISGGRTRCEDHLKRWLIGKNFGELTVTGFSHQDKDGRAFWYTDCSCGKKDIVVSGGHLTDGHTKSCGHLIGNPKDMTMNKYGLLKPLYPTDKRNFGSVIWVCQCDCGNLVERSQSSLQIGDAISCGCVKSLGEANITNILQTNNIPYIPQMTFETCRFPESNALARFDFYVIYGVDPFICEYDGSVHDGYAEGESNWNTKERFLTTINHDLFKNNWCKENELTIKRIPSSLRDTVTLDDIMSDKYLITPQTHPYLFPETSYPYYNLQNIDQYIDLLNNNENNDFFLR